MKMRPIDMTEYLICFFMFFHLLLYFKEIFPKTIISKDKNSLYTSTSKGSSLIKQNT